MNTTLPIVRPIVKLTKLTQFKQINDSLAKNKANKRAKN